MRRENRRKDKTSSNMSVYITGGILILSIVAFVISFVIYSNKADNGVYTFDSEYLSQYTNSSKDMSLENKTTSDNTSTIVSSSIGNTIEESKNNLKESNEDEKSKNNSIESSNNTNSVTEEKVKIKQNKTTSKEKKTEKDPVFERPIEGDILKEFCKDSLTYSETLKEWTTHYGVDIKAERASVVKSAAAGTVEYIKNDPRYGLTIIIKHSNGFKSLYANLLTTEFISENEEVKVGQTIGTVGDTAVYEIVDEPHLHFEILKNNENVNPSEYIKF